MQGKKEPSKANNMSSDPSAAARPQNESPSNEAATSIGKGPELAGPPRRFLPVGRMPPRPVDGGERGDSADSKEGKHSGSEGTAKGDREGNGKGNGEGNGKGNREGNGHMNQEGNAKGEQKPGSGQKQDDAWMHIRPPLANGGKKGNYRRKR